jgi:hypothetical protein
MHNQRPKNLLLFIKRASLFLLIFFVLDIILPLFYFQTIYTLNLKNTYEIEYSDVIILGDSHTAFGVDPNLFQENGLSAKNYSKGGHYPEFNYYFYKKYRENNPPPKVVFISSPYFIFSDSNKDLLFYLLDKDAFINYYFKNIQLLTPNLYKYNKLFQNLPLFASRMFSSSKHILDYGYVPKNSSIPITKDSRINSVEAINQIGYSEYYSKNINNYKRASKYLNMLLEDLNNDGVKTYLVETPEYYTTKSHISNKNLYYDEINEIASKYENTEFLNQDLFSSINSKNNNLFYDTGINSHLNYAGSQLLSNKLLEILNND